MQVVGKNCNYCKKDKNLSEFHSDKYAPLGKKRFCKLCEKELRRNKYLENPDYYRTAALKYRNNNIEKCRERDRKFAKINRDIGIKKCKKKRSLTKLSTPNWLNLSQKNVMKAVVKSVKYLNSIHGLSFCIDHIVPISSKNVCGLNVPWNIQILTLKENAIKSNKFDGTNENSSWKKG